MEHKVERQILRDHKKIGKKLITPMNYMLKISHKDACWLDDILPEVIWIALINELYGLQECVRLLTELTKACVKVVEDKKRACCFSVTHFLSLEEEEKASIRRVLEERGCETKRLGIALHVLHSTYPKSPFGFLTDKVVIDQSPEKERQRLKKTIDLLYSKTIKEAIFAQANAINILAVSGRLIIRKGLHLADINEIVRYPETDKSKLV